MKTITVHNSELQPVTIALNFKCITIPPLGHTTIETESTFVISYPDDTWQSKYIDVDKTEIKLYKNYYTE